MKYYINNRDELIIYNDFDNHIFGIDKNNNWIKNDYDQNDEIIYHRGSNRY